MLRSLRFATLSQRMKADDEQAKIGPQRRRPGSLQCPGDRHLFCLRHVHNLSLMRRCIFHRINGI